MASKKGRSRYVTPDPDDVPPPEIEEIEIPSETPVQDPPVRIRIETDGGEFVFDEHEPIMIPSSPPDSIAACRVQQGQRLLIDGKTHVVRAVGFA